MAFPFKRFEEYRTSSTLLHLCTCVRESLPRRSHAGDALLAAAGEVSARIARAAAAQTRRGSVRELEGALKQVTAVERQLRMLRRRRRCSAAHVTAGLEITERLAEQITHRIERLERRR